MSKKPHFVAPCAPTRAPGTSGAGKTTTHMPDELLTEQVHRLAIVSAVLGALWTYGLLIDLVIVPAFLPSFADAAIHGAGVPIEIGGIVLAALTCVYLRFAPHTAHTKTAVGLGNMVANAAGIGMLNNWIAPPAAAPGLFISWNTSLILVFAMIAPTVMRRMLPAALLAASMDPLMAWVAHLRGLPTLALVPTILLYLPNYTAAVLSIVPGRIMHRIGRRLKEAQEMGSYELIDLLGQGGMGEVWRARHRLLARNAAIKLVRPEALGNGNAADGRTMLRRFEREAQATASLSSPHTIRVFDYGMTGEGTFYYVMELLSGRDMESLVKEFGPLPAHRTLALMRQVCHSLADAHARGMVHRDVKPANLYVCRMGLEYDFVKVLDFGLVKLSDRATRQTMMTVEHTTSGTPAYMAPEVILGEAEVDPRADVYALGCVAYYLLTGELVFEADTSMKMMLQHVNAEPIPPSQRTELSIPRELDELVLACLRKDPRQRPQNALELFDLAHRCKSCDTWTQEAAKTWWERHLPEMTGPLVLGDQDRADANVVGVRH